MARAHERRGLLGILPVACVAMAASLAHCNADKSDGSGAITTACEQLMSAYCNKMAACDPIGIRREFGDVAACVARQSLGCAVLRLAGSGWTSDKVQACTAQIQASADCYDNVVGSGACDDVPGTLSDGTGCEQSSQCMSHRCDRTTVSSPDGGYSTPTCGVCASADAGVSPPPRCGDASTCESPLRCVYDNSNGSQQCMLPQPEGAPCTSTYACAGALFCKRAASDGGTSVCAKRGAAGAPCASSDECESTAGVRCVSGVCDAPTFVSVGETCDANGRLCERGARCIYPSSTTPMATGTCQAAAEDGSPCTNTSSGPYCLAPASCRGGICHLPGDAQCQ